MRIFGDDILEPVAPLAGPSIWWVLGIVAVIAAITAAVIVILRKRKKEK